PALDEHRELSLLRECERAAEVVLDERDDRVPLRGGTLRRRGLRGRGRGGRRRRGRERGEADEDTQVCSHARMLADSGPEAPREERGNAAPVGRTPALRILTVGHSNRDLQDLLELLRI